MPSKRKIIVQAYSEGEWKPMHFCRIDKDLADAYYVMTGVTASTIVRVFEKWAMSDFALTLQNMSEPNVSKFRKSLTDQIRARYRAKGIAHELLNDNLLTTWVSTHMREELEENGRYPQ